MLDWFSDHKALVWWLTAASFVAFVASLIAGPIIIARIPPDYFAKNTRPPSPLQKLPPAARIAAKVAKNALGVILILIGVVMLVAPGQGVVMILIGLLLTDIPGKFRAERWLVSRKHVLHAINWIRHRRGRENLQLKTDS